jgi:hypothetical protein
MQRAAHFLGRPLYQVFLNLSKGYDTLDRAQMLEMLEKYGVGQRVCQLLKNFWESLVVVARQQGYYSHPIASERGTTQGDIVSPTIFNIVVDDVVRAWYHSNSNPQERDDTSLWNNPAAIFYADHQGAKTCESYIIP